MNYTPANHPLRGIPVDRSTIDRMMQIAETVRSAIPTSVTALKPRKEAK